MAENIKEKDYRTQDKKVKEGLKVMSWCGVGGDGSWVGIVQESWAEALSNVSAGSGLQSVYLLSPGACSPGYYQSPHWSHSLSLFTHTHVHSHS